MAGPCAVTDGPWPSPLAPLHGLQLPRRCYGSLQPCNLSVSLCRWPQMTNTDRIKQAPRQDGDGIRGAEGPGGVRHRLADSALPDVWRQNHMNTLRKH